MNFDEHDYRRAFEKVDLLIPYELAKKSSVPILTKRGNAFCVLGTGTLFRIADTSFLVTATHVIEEADNKKLVFTVPHSDDIIPLGGMGFLANRDPFDIGVIQLDSQVSNRLEDKNFLRLHHVCDERVDNEGLYCLLGYPEIMCEHENGILDLIMLYLTVPPYIGETSALDGYQEIYHLLLDARKSDIKGVDGKTMEFRYRGGVDAPFPRELKGISGSSVWRIANKPTDVHAKNCDKARIVGVQTSIYQNRQCIRATYWKAVMSMLTDAIPELRRAIELFRPN